MIAIIPRPSAALLVPHVTTCESDLQGLGERLGEALLREMRATGEARIQQLWPMHIGRGGTDLPLS